MYHYNCYNQNTFTIPKGIVMQCEDCEKVLGEKRFDDMVKDHYDGKDYLKAVYEAMR